MARGGRDGHQEKKTANLSFKEGGTGVSPPSKEKSSWGTLPRKGTKNPSILPTQKGRETKGKTEEKRHPHRKE